jgi:hypothetical protein
LPRIFSNSEKVKNSETSRSLENNQNQHRRVETNEQQFSDDDVVMMMNQEYRDKERFKKTGTKLLQETNAPNVSDTTSVQYTDSLIPKSIL